MKDSLQIALNFLCILITHFRETYLKTLNLIMWLTLTQFAVTCLFMISHSAYCIEAVYIIERLAHEN